MSHPAYPLDSDIEAFVAGSGIRVPAGFDFTGYGAAAAATWEGLVGWHPFLQEAAAVERTFDAPGGWCVSGRGRILPLNAGLASAAAVTRVTASGVTLAADRWRLLPLNGAQRARPYSMLELFAPASGAWGDVAVLALWGVTADLPEDVWQACLRLGGASAAEAVLQGLMAGRSKIKAGENEITQNGFAGLGREWLAFAQGDPGAATLGGVAGRYAFRNTGLGAGQ